MKYIAEIQALDPLTKKLKTYIENIEIPFDTIDEANQWCQNNYKGYMWVTGFWEGEVEVTENEMNNIQKNIQEKCKCDRVDYIMSPGMCFNCGLPRK